MTTPAYKFTNYAFLESKDNRSFEKTYHPKGTSKTRLKLKKNEKDPRLIQYLAATGFNQNGLPFQFILAINQADEDEVNQFAERIADIITQSYSGTDKEIIRAIIKKISESLGQLTNFTIALTAAINCGSNHSYIGFCNGDFHIAKRSTQGTKTICNPQQHSANKIARLAYNDIALEQTAAIEWTANDELCCVLNVDIAKSSKQAKRSLYTKLTIQDKNGIIITSTKIPTQKQIEKNIKYIESHDHTLTKLLLGVGFTTSLAGLSYPALIGFGAVTVANNVLGASASAFLALNWWVILSVGLGLLLASGVNYLITELNLFESPSNTDSSALQFADTGIATAKF